MAEENKDCMPRLRFPEFRGPTTWEISPLSKVIKTIIPPKKILTQEYEKDGKIPIIDQSKEKIAGYTNDLSSVIKINKPVIVFGDHTCIIKYIDFDFAQGADGIKIIDPINIIPRYLFEYLCYFPVNPTGYSRHFSILKEKSIGFPPSIKEQQKIADCLSSLDELIEAHEQKRDALLEHKKGLMQRLFPAEGETTPRWRFPGFSSPWSIIPLDAVSSISSGLTTPQVDYITPYKVSRIETISSGIINMEKVGYIEHINNIEQFKLESGDILFSNINSIDHIGKSAYFNSNNLLYHGMNLLRIKASNGNFPKFLFYFINTDICRESFRRRANKAVNQASINQTELGKTLIKIPSYEEQQKIADCLSSLDAHIEAEEAKITALREHKQGLMQRLFPQSL